MGNQMAKGNDIKGLQELNGAGIQTPIIVNDQSVEPVVNQEFSSKMFAEEKFMNEIVEITVSSTGDENEEPHILMNVNGINQVFIRDVPVKCRRMFAEVLARCKKTKYRQERNAIELDRSELVGSTSYAYPFTMVDENPKGQAWLRAVKAEAN